MELRGLTLSLRTQWSCEIKSHPLVNIFHWLNSCQTRRQTWRVNNSIDLWRKEKKNFGDSRFPPESDNMLTAAQICTLWPYTSQRVYLATGIYCSNSVLILNLSMNNGWAYWPRGWSCDKLGNVLNGLTTRWTVAPHFRPVFSQVFVFILDFYVVCLTCL